MSAAINAQEVKEYEEKKAKIEAEGGRIKDEDKVRSIIPFQACLDEFCAPEMVKKEDEMKSWNISLILVLFGQVDYTVAGEKSVAKKTMRLQTFPDYLMIQLKKFDIGPGWVPFKLDVEVQMPDEMDLSQLTAKGLQEGEEEMPKEEEVR